MFDLPPQSLSFIERMRGQERSAQSVAVTRAELDAIVDQLLVPLFQKQGLDVTAEQLDDGRTITIKY